MNSLLNLILQAARRDLFFSHRIWFFFQSVVFTSDDEGTKKRELGGAVLKQLKKLCIESEELLCLVNAQDLTRSIIKFGMLQ